MSDEINSNSDPNTEGEGFTQIILPTELLIDMGRRLRDDVELTEEQKAELLSAIMRAIG